MNLAQAQEVRLVVHTRFPENSYFRIAMESYTANP
jgi:hypothetical protein